MILLNFKKYYLIYVLSQSALTIKVNALIALEMNLRNLWIIYDSVEL